MRIVKKESLVGVDQTERGIESFDGGGGSGLLFGVSDSGRR